MKQTHALPKQLRTLCTIACLWLLASSAAFCQDAASAIRKAMDNQVAAWNRDDLDAFMAEYKNSPDTMFIGKNILHGWQQGLERYKRAYANKDAMGTLDFSDIDIHLLDDNHAMVTGRFHLARNTAGGGDASGVYSLVWEKTAQGWKIILDHTS